MTRLLVNGANALGETYPYEWTVTHGAAGQWRTADFSAVMGSTITFEGMAQAFGAKAGA